MPRRRPPATDVTIRRATHADIDAMCELLLALFRIEADFSGDADIQRHGLKLLIDGCGKHRTAMVADIAEKVVGMASAQMVVSTAEGGWSVWVEDVVVDGALRGQGIGARLIAAVEDWAVAAGAVRMQLLADKGNAAAADFYRKHGWQGTQLVCLRKHPKS